MYSVELSATANNKNINSARDNEDCSFNNVVFGVIENRVVLVRRNKIDEILKFFFVDCDVGVRDALRLGRFRPDKMWLVLVTLQSA